MSDNTFNVTKLGVIRPRRLWRVILLCLTVAVVAAALVLVLFSEELDLDSAFRRLRYGAPEKRAGYGSFSFAPHATNRYALFDGGVAIAFSSGLETRGENGVVTYSAATVMEEPAVKTAKELLLHYSVGGSELSLIHAEKGEVLKLSSEGGFYDADLSSGGTLCTAAAESGYKTVLRVYDADQKEVYRWFSASRFMPLCAVSPHGERAAAVSLGQSEGSFESVLHLFSTREEEPVADISLGSDLVYDLRYTDDGTLCVVTESALFWFDDEGEQTGRCDILSGYLSDFDLSGDKFSLLRLNMFQTGEQCTVAAVNNKGEELGSVYYADPVLDISANGKYAAVLTSRKLTVYRRDLSVYAECANETGASVVLLRPDGTAFLLTDSASSLFIP